jgi:hypothetical protein
MRAFTCPSCSTRLFFANLTCSCGAAVRYRPETDAFTRDGADCRNRAAIGCNWAAASNAGGLCRACAMTEVVPDAAASGNKALWSDAELSKRRVLVGFARWGWFAACDPGPRPRFHLLSESLANGSARVMMGHQAGLVTINVTEADHAVRVVRREAFKEPYRTMTGHHRHELGHFMFERLAGRLGFLPKFRAMFGDERADYAAALARHHAKGPPGDWRARHVSDYASAHPHEDWAESFAHLLHLTEIIDSFAAEGLGAADLPVGGYDPYGEADAGKLISLGVHLGIALNRVNRAMGLADIYPFVLSAAVRDKLAFVHGWMRVGPAQI